MRDKAGNCSSSRAARLLVAPAGCRCGSNFLATVPRIPRVSATGQERTSDSGSPAASKLYLDRSDRPFGSERPTVQCCDKGRFPSCPVNLDIVPLYFWPRLKEHLMFGKSSTKQSAERLIEEQLYEQVVIELSEGKQRQGLWAKAIADSEGSEEKAKSLYIRYRVQSIKDELSLAEEARAKKEESEYRERQRQVETERALERGA